LNFPIRAKCRWLCDVKTSCGCTIPEWPRKPVKPGAKGEIKVKYDAAFPGVFQHQTGRRNGVLPSVEGKDIYRRMFVRRTLPKASLSRLSEKWFEEFEKFGNCSIIVDDLIRCKNVSAILFLI